MNSGRSKEPLLQKRSELNYFLDDSEYYALPAFQTTLWDQIKRPNWVGFLLCAAFLVERFFFILAVKEAKECE